MNLTGAPEPSTTDSTRSKLSGRAWMTLLLLGLLYFMSFVDRFILALLVEPLKRDLGVSDVQLGLLFGTAFAIFYAALGLPFARWADRSNRRRIVIAGAVLWSLSTIASGFATSYTMLVLLRLGLAIGEAALTPCAFSMIGDMFPAHRRRRAASVYSAIGMVGAGGGFLVGGLVIRSLDLHFNEYGSGQFAIWQLVFIAVGSPSLILAVSFAMLTREPERQGGAGSAPVLREVIRFASSRGAFFPALIVGAGLCQIPAYAMIAWMPRELTRSYDIPPAETGLIFGPIAIAATVIGTLLLPFLTDRLTQRWGEAAAPRLSSLSAIVGLAALALTPLQLGAMPFMLCSAVGLLTLTGAANNIVVAFQHFVPSTVRATFAALCLLSITLLGLGFGPPLFALIRNILAPTGHGGAALAGLAVLSVAPAIFLLHFATRRSVSQELAISGQ